MANARNTSMFFSLPPMLHSKTPAHMPRKTTLICTLGPATGSEEVIGQLIDAGANVFRFNMSHAKPEWVRRVVQDIRSLAERHKRAVGILLDTQGPSIRPGDVAQKI